MGNEQNLKPFTSEQSREEAVKNGKKGGIASGEARKKKKAIKDIAELIMNMPLKEGKASSVNDIQNLASAQGKNISVQEALVLKLTQKALKGDIQSMRMLFEIAGQDPSQSGNEPVESDGLMESIEEAAKLWQCN